MHVCWLAVHLQVSPNLSSRQVNIDDTSETMIIVSEENADNDSNDDNDDSDSDDDYDQ